MNFLQSVICSFSIIIAAIIAAWRFGNIHPVFRPFIFCIWLACFNELLSFVLVRSHLSNVVNANIYVLVESLLICWQFRRWGLFGKQKKIYLLLLGMLSLVWVSENFIFFSIFQFSSWFRILYSFIIVLMAISLLNGHIVRERGALLKNPLVLICLAYIIYYTFKVLVEVFWVYGLNESTAFQIKIYFILDCVNLFCNLIYALAVLWMPTKHRFTLQF
jgi:hypothetical protein